MRRKDYELIAGVIAGMPAFAPNLRTARDSCARAFAERLATDNPRFDRARFLRACGVES